MWNDRRLGSLIYPILLLAVAPGCQALYSYRPVTVLARDAETKRPIAAAQVRISYPLTPASVAPWDSSGTTAEDGTAHLKAAPSGDAGIMVEASASGYLFEEKNLALDTPDAESGRVVLEMYAEPRPTIELVLPNGYHGMIRADVRVEENAPCPPGQRRFLCAVPASGDVEVIGPPLLRRVLPTDFCARYEDGTPLSRQAKVTELGFWWVKNDKGCQHFFVGTGAEHDGVRRIMEHDEQRGRPTPETPRQGEDRRPRRDLSEPPTSR